MSVLVTGASGFVGRALTMRLLAEGRVVCGTRRRGAPLAKGVQVVAVGDLGADTDWRAAVAGVQTVVHLAARVHVMRDAAADPLQEFRRANVDGTVTLARQAVAAGVRRFIFLSSAKVNGESGAFRETDPPNPHGPYAISKQEAEAGLREISASTGLEVVIIRAPLVYGPGVKANFRSLIDAVAKGIPLPLGASENRRSLVALPNLVDLIVTCMEHPSAANETFFVSDGEDLSTTELVRRIANAIGKPARVIPLPSILLWIVATLVGRRDVAQRLLGTLQLDVSKARRVLGWHPPLGIDEALKSTVGAQR